MAQYLKIISEWLPIYKGRRYGSNYVIGSSQALKGWERGPAGWDPATRWEIRVRVAVMIDNMFIMRNQDPEEAYSRNQVRMARKGLNRFPGWSASDMAWPSGEYTIRPTVDAPALMGWEGCESSSKKTLWPRVFEEKVSRWCGINKGQARPDIFVGYPHKDGETVLVDIQTGREQGFKRTKLPVTPISAESLVPRDEEGSESEDLFQKTSKAMFDYIDDLEGSPESLFICVSTPGMMTKNMENLPPLVTMNHARHTGRVGGLSPVWENNVQPIGPILAKNRQPYNSLRQLATKELSSGPGATDDAWMSMRMLSQGLSPA